MSPRAACRLETLGFSAVYDYVPGKADWRAHNLPVAGRQADLATAGRVARDDVVTCALDARAATVRDRIRKSRYPFAVVTSPGGVVLGRVRGSVLELAAGGTAEDHLDPGPSTVRPDTPATKLATRFADRDLNTAIVTTPKGELIGIVLREDLEGS